jgi:hypothetical protein
MRQPATLVVVAALAILGLAAAVDALQGGEARPAADATTTVSTSTVLTAPPSLEPGPGLEGVLYYTDERCRLRALELPRLNSVETPDWEACAFSLSPTGQDVEPSWTVWSPSGARAADLVNSIEVRPGGRAFRGAVPAWRPDGVLTYADEGVVRAWPSRTVLIAPRDLRPVWARQIGTLTRSVEFVRVKQLAWLSSTRAVLILGIRVRSGSEFEFTALFERGRLASLLAQSSPRLWTSPGGRFFALGGNGDLQLYNRDGEAVPLPITVTEPQAIAWSPDERWVAVSTGASIFLVRMSATDRSVRRLPVEAHDLAWLAGAEKPPAGAAPLRRWLKRAGVGGDLFFSDASCQVRVLKLPDVRWADERRVEGPCRFSVGEDGRIHNEGMAVQPEGDLVAGCDGHNVDVFTSDGRFLVHRDRACAPAWRPDGALSYIDAGELRVSPRLRGERVVLSSEEVTAALGPKATLEEVAWIDNRRFAAAVRQERIATLAVFDGRRLVHPPGFSALRIEHLRVGRGLIAALTSGPGAPSVTFFDLSGGRTFALGGHAFSWSPGGRIVAVAGRERIYFVEAATGEFRVLQVQAVDIEWR